VEEGVENSPREGVGMATEALGAADSLPPPPPTITPGEKEVD